MTLLVETSFLIAMPPERVWAVLTEFADYVVWNPYVMGIEGRPNASTGLQLTTRPRPDGDTMTQPVDLVALDPPCLMCREGDPPNRAQFKGDHRFRLIVEAHGTRFDHFEIFSGSLAKQILASHGDTIRTAFDRYNLALKNRCETRS